MFFSGLSFTTTPFVSFKIVLISSQSVFSENSMFTDSAWPPKTGILTAVAEIFMLLSDKIL